MGNGGRNGRSGGSVLAAVIGGLAVAVVTTVAWVLVSDATDGGLAFLALLIGPAVGLTMWALAGSRRTVWIPITAALTCLVAAFLGQNVLQREQLYDGIEALQAEWDELAISAAGADTGGTASGSGEGEDAAEQVDEIEQTEDLTSLSAEDVEGVIPPPAIVEVMPAPAFDLMTPEVLAVVMVDIPEDVLADVNPDLVAEAEALIQAEEDARAEARQQAQNEAEAAAVEAELAALDNARASYRQSEEDYHIPRAVAECATIPDFTQDDAASGMGFPDGVPLVLPLHDLLNDPPERGDGLEADEPSPACFAVEHAQEEPVEAGAWVGAIGLAFFLPLFLGRNDDDDDDEAATTS